MEETYKAPEKEYENISAQDIERRQGLVPEWFYILSDYFEKGAKEYYARSRP